MATPITQTVRGYELRELLGRGGFGAVYRAHQGAVEREVAIKIILPEFANQPDFIRRFEAEAQLVARLEHPYIVPLYDYWREPEGAYLVMRLLRGGSLRAELKDAGAWQPAAAGASSTGMSNPRTSSWMKMATPTPPISASPSISSIPVRNPPT